MQAKPFARMGRLVNRPRNEPEAVERTATKLALARLLRHRRLLAAQALDRADPDLGLAPAPFRRRRGRGRAARRVNATNRSSASSRLRSRVRWRRAVMTSTPSWVRRWPPSRSSRARTASGRLGLARASKRSWTAVETLLTF
jgi:hypothetical protein